MDGGSLGGERTGQRRTGRLMNGVDDCAHARCSTFRRPSE
jgi:hypothetical protein